MHASKFLVGIFALSLFLSGPNSVSLEAPSPEARVWAVDSGAKKIYHCRGSKWFGVGAGREIGECDAIRQGYKPAQNGRCGPGCK